MSQDKADIETDIQAPLDHGEDIAAMEPLQVSDAAPRREALTELAVELAAKSAGFSRSLPDGVVSALADLVRAMNCYYSNLIEGHDTHPVDIERAMQNDYSDEPRKRDLQLEARAHVTVQQWIDEGGLAGRATTIEGVCEIHRRFGEALPEELLWIEDPQTGERIRMTPGELRGRDVIVGNHVAISAGALPRFLRRFEQVYSRLGNAQTIVSTAAAHHRFLWIHPFLDGNGRVARLMSYAMLREALDTGGIWSIARGLARQEARYKQHLVACDQPRRGDLDGRGSRSEAALAEFTEFFLQTCIDQVAFMEQLVQPNRLRERIRLWVEEEVRLGGLPSQAGNVLEAVLYRGDLPRGDVPSIVGTGGRQSQRIVSALLKADVLQSSSSRAPLRIAFPARLAGRWMPGLFPEAAN
ncbi:MAG: cell filamentation protein Fic [Hyphomonas sp.]|jgi:Fic family protein|uniref:Fic family protein n=1 Tax=Haliea alexandrii TaxID=2448162 RepID=UPI000C4C1F9B|nr:Fic family protein [Haliea alexandrii]MAA80726.1 cell filamentation protein Fic [Hyphomonas sp.]|tara:strand:- start:2175 stop:3410 length:1236 start_codon:yes stop_codon:yes gene_type:complete